MKAVPDVLHYFSELSMDRRHPRADRHLGYVLAMVAGGINAAGFLAVGRYTSPMTGFVSSIADHLAYGTLVLALSALSAWLAFLGGAIACTVLVNLARRRALHSQFALSLALESLLLWLFAFAAHYLLHGGEWLMRAMVLLLCFAMGLQNAVITKASGAIIRTTHITGLSTDLGIQLGRLFYVNGRSSEPPVRADRARMRLYALLIACFLGGGVVGAFAFRYLGYRAALAPAAVLAALAMGPLFADLRHAGRLSRRPGPGPRVG